MPIPAEEAARLLDALRPRLNEGARVPNASSPRALLTPPPL